MTLDSQHYVIAYGSLLSHDSRSRFSAIDCHAIPVQLKGWRRAWTTRTLHEQQTCLSAKVDKDASFNGALVPIEQLSPQLAKREQDYEFVQVDTSQLSLLTSSQHKLSHTLLAEKQIWICQNKKNEEANSNYPICQTYVDTCLAGCLETDLDDFAGDFLQSTLGWRGAGGNKGAWINDRSAPRYPRAAAISQQRLDIIDQILAQANLLQFRQET